MELTYYLLAAIVGLIIGYLICSVVTNRNTVSKAEYETAKNELNQTRIDLASRPTKQDIADRYVAKETYELANKKLDAAEHNLVLKDGSINELTGLLAEYKAKEGALDDKVKTFATEIERLQEQSKQQFKSLATDILEEKRKLFVESNKAELTNILDPLKTDIGTFKKTIEDTRKEDIEDLTKLKGEIANLHQLNIALHDDAQNLTNALKSDMRIQGTWGEDRLNMILEAEGLQKYIDFTVQASFKDDEDEKRLRPDCVLNLPDNKHLIIDSKVSLVAYVNYFSATDANEKAKFLKQHLKSVTDHIDSLADKKYQTLQGLNTPDYVFMFMPIEPALTLALNESADLFNRALNKKIVITTPSTFVATLKVVKIIWQKENQVKNVEKIFDECGKLYDKFVAFVGEMERIESGLNTATNAFHDAMNSLSEGQKKGITIMGRFERIRQLEAKTTKLLPNKYVAEINDVDNEINLLTEGDS